MLPEQGIIGAGRRKDGIGMRRETEKVRKQKAE